MIISCPHCEKPVNLAENLMKITPEAALLELLIAQMSRTYRLEFQEGYPLNSQEDMSALKTCLQTFRDEEDRLSAATLSEIAEAWREYLGSTGKQGRISTFAFAWMSGQEEGENEGRVIPFRRRT